MEKIDNSFPGVTNILFSGLQGQALTVEMKDVPTMADVQRVVPDKCFTRNTPISLGYLLQSFCIQVLVVLVGFFIPLSQSMIPLWILYAIVSGTTAMGFWVLAHECGHGAFSDNRKLQDFIGYCLHSMLLVPYFSWQRSHAIHHRFTNQITDGETHVPLVIGGDGIKEKAGGEKELVLSSLLGENLYGSLQLVLHLLVGWPAYLLAGQTGGPRYGTSNHFWPIAPFSKKLWPSFWAKKVWISDLGVLFVFALLLYWGFNFGFLSVLTLYVAPLLVVNIWLVIYTWLHHTDTDVPHLSASEFSYMRGAFLSIDRPYGKILDFLHHRIGSTHVIHHIAPTIPHYHAREATLAIKKAFPKAYLYNSTPIHLALWNVAKYCIAVTPDNQTGRYLWQNK